MSDMFDDLDIDDDDELSVKFNSAAQHVQKLASSQDNATLLNLYGLYKQGNEGNINIPRPNWYDLRAKSKYDSWKRLENMSQDEAKRKYIDLVESLDQNFASSSNAKTKSDSWVSVSTMQRPPNEIDKSITDFIKNGKVEDVKAAMHTITNINMLDEDGLGLLHWAADRGSVDILQLLLGHNAINVNLQDRDGQVPLHYAVSCEHIECIECLLQNGADPSIKDSDGLDCFAAASDETVLSLLKDFVRKE